MRRLVLDHLEDILENALAASDFVGRMSCEAFAADRKTGQKAHPRKSAR